MATTGLNDLNDIPRAWRSALASIQTLAPEAVIAGGCLRDREHGVKVKDIDIFVPCESVDSHEGKLFEQRMKNDGWQDVQTLHDESYNGSRISRSIETMFPGCPPINIIVMPYALIEFDFGICQIEFNGKRILRTRDYNIDFRAKQFRLVPKVGDAEFVRSLNRWARLKEKYEGWKLNLGSRAEQPGTITGYIDYASGGPLNMPGVRTLAQAMTMAKTTQLAPPRTADMIHTLNDLSGHGPGEYIVDRAIAERLARETTAQIIGQHRNSHGVVVKVDDKAVIPMRKIVEDMLVVRDRLSRKYTSPGQP